MYKYVALFFFFIFITILIVGTQLGRPLATVFTADNFPGGVGKIYGSARIADEESDNPGLIMRVTKKYFDSGTYQLVVDYNSNKDNISIELCSDIFIPNINKQRRKNIRIQTNSVFFGKHFEKYEDPALHPNKECTEKIPLTLINTISNKSKVYKFTIDKDYAYKNLEIRAFYDGTGKLKINRIILNDFIPELRNNYFSNAFFFSLFVVIPILLLVIYQSNFNFFDIKKLIILCSPFVIILIYYLINFYPQSQNTNLWNNSILHYISLMLLSILAIFLTTNNFFKKIRKIDRCIIFIVISLAVYLLAFSHTFLKPKISFTIKSTGDQTWTFFFDKGLGDGLSNHSSTSIKIIGDNKFHGYSVSIPSNEVKHIFIKIAHSSKTSNLSFDIMKVQLSTILEYKYFISKKLYYGIKPIKDINIIGQNQDGTIHFLLKSKNSAIELANKLFTLDTYNRKQTIQNMYWFIICIILFSLFFIIKENSDLILTKIKKNDMNKTGTIIIILFMIFSVLIILITGPTFSSIYPLDTFTILDGVWRELNGIRTHVNYDSGVYGHNIFLPALIGYLFDHHSTYIFAYGNAVVFLVLTSISWIAANKRLFISSAIIFPIYVGIIIIGTHALGMEDGYNKFSLAMSYNRYGHALISILTLLIFFPNKRNPNSDFHFIGIGLIISFLLFFKLNYFIVSLFLLFTGGFFIKWSVKRISILIISFLLLFIINLSHIKFNLISMFNDFLGIILLATHGPGFLTKLFIKFHHSFTEFAPLAVAICLIFLNKHYPRKEIIKFLTSTISITLAGLLLITSNFQIHESILIFISYLYIFDYFIFKYLEFSNNQSKIFLAITTLLMIVSCNHSGISHFDHLIKSFKYKVVSFSKKSNTGRYIPRSFRDLMSSTEKTPKRFNQLIIAIHPLLNEKDRVFFLAHNNQLSYCFKLKVSEKMEFHFWHYNYNFSINSHPLPSELFKDITVIIENRSKTLLQARLKMLYISYIQKHYTLIKKTKSWNIYRIKTSKAYPEAKNKKLFLNYQVNLE